MAGQLDGKVALVTGGGSGIGFATVERFVAEGATVIGLDISARGLARLAEAGVEAYRLDVGDLDQWHGVAATIMTRHGRIDTAFLNAGIASRPAGENLFGDVGDLLNIESYRRIMSVNADGAAFGAIALVPHMEATGGDIVITASVAGLLPFPHDPWYGMTKHAMVGLGRSLGPALASRGIRVNVMCPGATDTGILAPDQRAGREAELWAHPSFIADAVMSILAADDTGEVWVRYQPSHPAWRYEFLPCKDGPPNPWSA